MTIHEVIRKYKLDAELNPVITIRGKGIAFDLLIRGYGNINGMIIDSDCDKLMKYDEDIISSGYGWSCFDIGKLIKSDIKSFGVLLNDWKIQ